jgi:DNA-binding NarL/FixJ family response regulator
METNQIRVLLVDDHAVVRAGIRQFLEKTDDIRVVGEANNGKEAITLIEKSQPDVAVVDIQMPEMNGIDLTRWIRKNYRSMGVLILTAYDDSPYIMAVLQMGANGYVLKTADPDEIIHAIRDVNEGKSVLDPTVTQKVMEQLSGFSGSPNYEQLTDREMEVLTMVAKGLTNKGIGVQLGISDRTVQGHLAHIFEKLQASSRTEAVMRAVSLGWLPDDLGVLGEI